MTTTLALDHLVLMVEDVERTLDWYGRHAGLGGVRVDEWRRGEAPFPSLRVGEATIIDVIPRGGDDGGGRGHLDHICFAVSASDRERLAADAELEVVDEGPRFGARGIGDSIYVRDPDGLLVEFRSYPDLPDPTN
jgi:catechol 2,3-dioxygenase-like lactoylglutathione lyase family enzyme